MVLFDVALSACDHAEGAAGVDADALLRREAFTRIVLAAGALQRLSQMTIDYLHDRRQFSKPVASFQAVQHHLVTVAQCAARASMAADVVTSSMSYYTTIGHGGSSTSDEVGIAIAAARVVVDAAITDGTRSAHQAHGAMGVTREYPLHLLTQRLWAWRHEYGSVTSWRRRLGRAVHEGGADALFPTISGRSESVGAAGPAAEQPCQVPT